MGEATGEDSQIAGKKRSPSPSDSQPFFDINAILGNNNEPSAPSLLLPPRKRLNRGQSAALFKPLAGVCLLGLKSTSPDVAAQTLTSEHTVEQESVYETGGARKHQLAQPNKLASAPKPLLKRFRPPTTPFSGPSETRSTPVENVDADRGKVLVKPSQTPRQASTPIPSLRRAPSKSPSESDNVPETGRMQMPVEQNTANDVEQAKPVTPKLFKMRPLTGSVMVAWYYRLELIKFVVGRTSVRQPTVPVTPVATPNRNVVRTGVDSGQSDVSGTAGNGEKASDEQSVVYPSPRPETRGKFTGLKLPTRVNPHASSTKPFTPVQPRTMTSDPYEATLESSQSRMSPVQIPKARDEYLPQSPHAHQARNVSALDVPVLQKSLRSSVTPETDGDFGGHLRHSKSDWNGGRESCSYTDTESGSNLKDRAPDCFSSGEPVESSHSGAPTGMAFNARQRELPQSEDVMQLDFANLRDQCASARQENELAANNALQDLAEYQEQCLLQQMELDKVDRDLVAIRTELAAQQAAVLNLSIDYISLMTKAADAFPTANHGTETTKPSEIEETDGETIEALELGQSDAAEPALATPAS
ncbi:uncharacterized protein EV422DRAFT_514231 [Fimicolochytrium jonesii]|uniref:uncharacterized protein n=1 Tax=Fimicolochytrium jonesii TaxID=1396493 RepID=UPI0022FE3C04|nr:uncharacterized protein EV422DRAFT_514231 [Fimicolochytrium jonesii]KAI8825809.1 hypothetical protein EV422DRAFT_514231 [Fimicolochytrium jonesii]